MTFKEMEVEEAADIEDSLGFDKGDFEAKSGRQFSDSDWISIVLSYDRKNGTYTTRDENFEWLASYIETYEL